MNKKQEYAQQWNTSAKYFYDKEYYNWMCSKLPKNSVVMEIGCGTGHSTLSLLENGHKVVSIEKNEECISQAKQLITKNDYSIGKTIVDADAIFVNTDIATEEFYAEVLPKIEIDIVICWNVGTYWDKEMMQFYLPYLLQYGLNPYQIKENPESSYSEMILWNACKIAKMKKVPVHLIDRSGELIEKEKDPYYYTLKDEFSFATIEYDNLAADSISGGGRTLVTNGKINHEKIIDTILVSVLIK